MKKILSLLLVFIIICAAMCGCEDEKKEKVDSFLVGGVWEATVQNNDESKPFLLAYQFKDDGSYVQYNNIIAISGGYFEQDGDDLTLISPDRTQTAEISCTYDKDKEILSLTGKIGNQENSPEATIKFKRIDEGDEKYYQENNTVSVEIKKEK